MARYLVGERYGSWKPSAEVSRNRFERVPTIARKMEGAWIRARPKFNGRVAAVERYGHDMAAARFHGRVARTGNDLSARSGDQGLQCIRDVVADHVHGTLDPE